MADTNIKIKLLADGTQVKRELNQIDNSLRELGHDRIPTSSNDQSSPVPRGNTSSSDIALQRNRDKYQILTYRELRKLYTQLETLNQHYRQMSTTQSGSNQPSGGSGHPPLPNCGNGSGNPPPSGGGNGGSGSGSGNGGNGGSGSGNSGLQYLIGI